MSDKALNFEILKDKNVLMFCRTMKLGGTENVVLQLCEIFKSQVNKIVVCSCGGVNVEKLEKLGIKHYTIPDIEKKSPLAVLKVIRVLLKIVKEEKINIVHCHNRMAAFYVSLLRLYKKCLFITTAHSTFFNKKFLTRFSYKHSNIIACGEIVKNNLIDFYQLSSSQVSVIHNAVKADNEPIREDKLLTSLKSQGSFIVANVGRLDEFKGFDYYIKSIPQIITKHSNVAFLIIGTGYFEKELRDLAKSLNVLHYVHFLGYRCDVRNIMKQVDLVVSSSFHEGLPLTPIEAFSVGRTIVATDVDGTVEIVEDNINGLLIKPKNAQMIADKVNYLIENPDILQNMEEKAKETFNKKFSFEMFKHKYVSLYIELHTQDLKQF